MVEFVNPPLIKFTITFLFKEITPPSIEELGKIESILNKKYPITPKFQLFTPNKIDVPINIGPLIYQDKLRTKQIDLSADSVSFSFFKYSTWSEVIKEVLNILGLITKVLTLTMFTTIVFRYHDEFKIDRKNFNFVDYFNVEINLPEIFSGLNFEDFHFGISPLISDDSGKFIIRLRGVKPDHPDSFKFLIESDYILKGIYELNDELNKILRNAHDLLTDHFISLLGEKNKKNLGFKE